MKATVSAVFGFPDESVEQAEQVVQKALGLALEKHDSMYLGIYSIAEDALGKFRLCENYNRFDEAWTEEEYKIYPTLLYATVAADKLACVSQALNLHAPQIKLLKQN